VSVQKIYPVFLSGHHRQVLNPFPNLSFQQVRCSPSSENYVHEALKRSRTSGPILQTALCYIEAVRPKVPEILCDTRLGVRAYFLPKSAILSQPKLLDRKSSNLERSDILTSDELLKTVRSIDKDTDDVCDTSSVVHKPTVTNPLPSPLLCPHRTFLAALILASRQMLLESCLAKLDYHPVQLNTANGHRAVLTLFSTETSEPQIWKCCR